MADSLLRRLAEINPKTEPGPTGHDLLVPLPKGGIIEVTDMGGGEWTVATFASRGDHEPSQWTMCDNADAAVAAVMRVVVGDS